MSVEHLDNLSEVEQRAREAVDLVDHHYIDLGCPDVGQQALQSWPVKRPS